MKTVYEPANAVEAHMLANLLRQAGFSPFIQGEHLTGGIGELPALGLLRLNVPEGEYPAARKLIEDWEADQTPAPSDAKPRMASTSARPWLWLATGLAFGATAMFGWHHAPADTSTHDHNRDGITDETWVYASSGHPVRVETDRNFDGKVDWITHFEDRAQATTSETDKDFDGRFETTIRWRAQQLVQEQSDSDGDGFPDHVSHYTGGELQRIEFLNPRSGLPLRVEHLRLSKLRFADVDADQDGRLDTRVHYSALGEALSREALPP